METYSRDQIGQDDVLFKLKTLIIRQHRPAEDVVKEVVSNKKVEGYTVTSTYFIVMDKRFFISYSVDEMWREHQQAIGVSLQSLTLYEDAGEYERSRQEHFKLGKPNNTGNPMVN